MLSSLRRIPLVVAIVLLAFGGVMLTRSAMAAPASAPHAQSSGANPTVCTWLDCKTGAISYSQDDVANINPGTEESCQDDLQSAGLRGTFYYDGATAPAWLATLSNTGHEVGSHLTNHDLNCAMPPACAPDCTPETLLQTPYTITDVNNFRQTQLDPNVTAIESVTGKPVVAMAWTCGNTDAGRMVASESYFVGSRGYYDIHRPGQLEWLYDINASTPVEFRNLNSDWYFHQELVDEAMNEGGWDIITVHDNCEGINALKNISQTMWIAPVGDVLKYIRVRNATQITNLVRAGYNISFDAVHTLGTFQRQRLDGTPLLPIVYDNPVTIRTPITTSANVVSVQLNGTNTTYTVGIIAGTKYVWFNTPLTATQHVNIQLDTPTAVRVSHLQAASSTPDLLPVLIVAGSVGACMIAMWKKQRRS